MGRQTGPRSLGKSYRLGLGIGLESVLGLGLGLGLGLESVLGLGLGAMVRCRVRC
jgi:hypothetical protein